MTASAQRDQVFEAVAPKLASRLDVMHLEIFRSAAMLEGLFSRGYLSSRSYCCWFSCGRTIGATREASQLSRPKLAHFVPILSSRCEVLNRGLQGGHITGCRIPDKVGVNFKAAMIYK